jgi:FkbM family methyltransferase
MRRMATNARSPFETAVGFLHCEGLGSLQALETGFNGLPRMENPMISYAQNFEDVMIARLFDAGYRGFYVDIGAAHPDFFSVTRHFYNQRWSGINVEPTFRFYPLLRKARPNDINLQCAVGNSPGRATFYEIPKFAENSTLERAVAEHLAATELTSTPHEVEVVRLSDLCALHVKDRTIDFMKIDVEGGELGVLQSGDWERFRPRLLVVEATVVNSGEENWQIWEPILIEANYHKVWFDGLNNFYLREEDLELRHAFRLPPNIHDGFETAELARLKRDGVQIGEQINALYSRQSFRCLAQFANWPELTNLAELLRKP